MRKEGYEIPQVKFVFRESGKTDNSSEDPYIQTTPEKVFEYVKSTVREVSPV